MTAPSADTQSRAYESRIERITQPAEIALLLQRIHEARAMLSVRLADDPSPYLTAIIGCDGARGELLLDELNPRRGHERFVALGRLTAQCKLRGVEMSFDVQLKETIKSESGLLYRTDMPAVVRYLQRRNAFRAPVPIQQGASLTLSAPGRDPVKALVCDISRTGIGARTAGPGLGEGDTWPDCEITLPEGASVRCAIELRYVGSHNANNYVRIGARFLELSPEQEKIIQRFVAKMERELLRKQPKDR